MFSIKYEQFFIDICYIRHQNHYIVSYAVLLRTLTLLVKVEFIYVVSVTRIRINSDYIGLNADEEIKSKREEHSKSDGVEATVKPHLSRLSVTENSKILFSSKSTPKVKNILLWAKIYSIKHNSRELTRTDVLGTRGAIIY